MLSTILILGALGFLQKYMIVQYCLESESRILHTSLQRGAL